MRFFKAACLSLLAEESSKRCALIVYEKAMHMPKVKLYATLRQITKDRERDVPGANVREVLENLAAVYDDGRFKRYLDASTVLVNKKNIRYLRGERTHLKHDDVVSIYPPLGGG